MFFSHRFTLPEYVKEVDEDLAPGTLIVNVTAVSASPPITYSIVAEGIIGNLFSMESATGRIFLRNRLTSDPENRVEYRIPITARDLDNSLALSTVKVIVRRNKHAPIIANARNITISRSQAIYQTITVVRATDLDRANTPNSQIR